MAQLKKDFNWEELFRHSSSDTLNKNKKIRKCFHCGKKLKGLGKYCKECREKMLFTCKKSEVEKWVYIIDQLDKVLEFTRDIGHGENYAKGDRVKVIHNNRKITIKSIKNEIFCYNESGTYTDKTFKCQLEDLIANNKINEEDVIIFEHIEYKGEYTKMDYNYSWKHEFKVKDILPYLSSDSSGILSKKDSICTLLKREIEKIHKNIEQAK